MFSCFFLDTVSSALCLATEMKCQVELQLSSSFNEVECILVSPTFNQRVTALPLRRAYALLLLLLWSKRQLLPVLLFRTNRGAAVLQVQRECSRPWRLLRGLALTVIYWDESGGVVNYQGKSITWTFTKLATSNPLSFPTMTDSLTLLFVFPQPCKCPRR